MSDEHGQQETEGAQAPRFRVRLPGFIVEEETGLGDAIKRVTSAAGIRPCGGCRQRAQVLNHWMVLTNRR